VAAWGPAAKRWIDERITGRPEPLAVAVVPSTARRATAPPPKPEIPTFVAQKSVASTFEFPAPTVSGVALLQDANLVAAGGDDGSVYIWRRGSGEFVHTRAGGTTKAAAVLAASPDGKWLAYSGADNAIELWDARAEKSAGSLPGHSAEISALAFSLDGKHLVSAALDKTVSLWDFGERRRLRHLVEDARADVRALAFAPNGRVLAAADARGGIRFWTTAGFNELSYVLVVDNALSALAFSPDSKWVATASSAHPIRLMRQGIDREDRVLEGAPETVHAIAFSPDGNWLIVAGANRDLLLWDLRTGALTERWSGHNHDVLALAISANGDWLASGGDDHAVRLWR
jgi:WD40 repeat protein